MTIDDVANGVVDWVVATCNTIVGKYPYAPMGKDLGLPDAATEVERVVIVPEDLERFPHITIQQAFLRTFDTKTSIMVNQGRTEAEASAAADQLRAYADQLTAALLADTTLGGRFNYVSPFIEFDFVPQFVRYEDGTRGRQVQMLLAVAELIGD